MSQILLKWRHGFKHPQTPFINDQELVTLNNELILRFFITERQIKLNYNKNIIQSRFEKATSHSLTEDVASMYPILDIKGELNMFDDVLNIEQSFIYDCSLKELNVRHTMHYKKFQSKRNIDLYAETYSEYHFIKSMKYGIEKHLKENYTILNEQQVNFV